MDKRTCSVRGCDSPHAARGLCDVHYQRARRLGTLDLTASLHWRVASLEDRFWAKVPDQGAGCWEWTGNKDSSGYGLMIVANRRRKAHRMVMEFLHGELPSTVYVCHHCDNPSCVRPDHLFLGSAADNTHDAMRKGRLQKPPHVPGEKHGAARLTAAQVRVIRQKSAEGASRAALGREYGVDRSTIGLIVNRKHWGTVVWG